MKAAVYSGTRNVYPQMVTAVKSLLLHSDVEKVYFLIEDDEFPEELPQEIECINVSNQAYFNENSPNFDNVCTYMVLLRAAYPKIFPDLDKILTLDNDTVINENISELWDLDLTDYYLAAVEETVLTQREGSYFNMGVAMLNLKKWREEQIDDKLIAALNKYWYRYKEQDCFNEFFRGHVLILPSDYNSCKQAAKPRHEKITHFAAFYNLKRFPHFDYYKELPLLNLERNLSTPITLDIIIPTYKNKQGLQRTLSSIQFFDNVNVIVVDDCSGIDYSDIEEQYPIIQLFKLPTNQGPGMARQYGLDHSNGMFVTFIDTDDYFYEDGVANILKILQNNTYTKMFNFSYVYDNSKVLNDIPDDKTIGKVYKRSFIDMYNIHFSKEGSYANEDYGFNRACRLILDDWERLGFAKACQFVKIPVFYEHIDKDSVTKKNNGEFNHTKLISGIIINGLHAIDIAKKAKIPVEYLLNEYNFILAQEYFFFLWTLCDRPEYVYDVWTTIRNFYLNDYSVYEKFALNNLNNVFLRMVSHKIRIIKNRKENLTLNIFRFVRELIKEEIVPSRYFN